MLDILEGKGYDREKWFNEGDETMELKIGENIIMGEIASIDNENIAMVYDFKNADIVRNYYHHDIALNKADTLYKI